MRVAAGVAHALQRRDLAIGDGAGRAIERPLVQQVEQRRQRVRRFGALVGFDFVAERAISRSSASRPIGRTRRGPAAEGIARRHPVVDVEPRAHQATERRRADRARRSRGVPAPRRRRRRPAARAIAARQRPKSRSASTSAARLRLASSAARRAAAAAPRPCRAGGQPSPPRRAGPAAAHGGAGRPALLHCFCFRGRRAPRSCTSP